MEKPVQDLRLDSMSTPGNLPTSPPPQPPAIPLNVTFMDTSDASPVKWLWDFGDGTNSTAQNPAHMYTTAGTYNISLKAWNDLGSDTMEKPFYITVRNPVLSGCQLHRIPRKPAMLR